MAWGRAVIWKLLAFALAMVVGPIGSYYVTLNTLFRGKEYAPHRLNWWLWLWLCGYACVLGADKN